MDVQSPDQRSRNMRAKKASETGPEKFRSVFPSLLDVPSTIEVKSLLSQFPKVSINVI